MLVGGWPSFRPRFVIPAKAGIHQLFADGGLARTLRITLVLVMNTYGAILLVGGVVYSAYIFWRKRVLAHRMWGNILNSDEPFFAKGFLWV